MKTAPPRRALLALAALALGFSSGCHRSSSHRVILPGTGVVAGDFQELEDYLDDPTVQLILANMPDPGGSDPPDVSGSYESNGIIVAASDSRLEGLEVEAAFCFGPAAAQELDVIVQDPTVVDAGARSFIEGNNDSFTVYTAFKSVQTSDAGGTCEIHEVNVFSGTLDADGDIADLFIGAGIVGLVGDCGDLLLGDVQISENVSDRTGDACPPAGELPEEPDDPDNVLVIVENNLVVDLLVFLGASSVPVLEVPFLSAASFETAPGFQLEFETLQPSAGQDDDGNDLLMGEIIAGVFPQDTTPAGDAITYSIENQVGTDTFFAPLPTNRTSIDVFSVVNRGVDIPGYPDPPGSGLDCLCILEPSPDPYLIGYYSYSVPGIIVPAQANVRFFNVDNESMQVGSTFRGPFDLDPLSGTVGLLLQ